MIKLASILLAFFLLLQGCGYQSIHKIKKGNFSIIKFDTNGDKITSRELTRNFEKFQIVGNSMFLYELITDSQINKEVRSKNSKGIAENFSINVIITIIVKENGIKIASKSFKENSNYANSENKFELSQYEKIITKNLTAKIIKKINLYIATLK